MPIIDGNMAAPIGKVLCCDYMSGRYFYGSPGEIEIAVIAANYHIIEHGAISMNSFYDILGLDPIEVGERLGWGEGPNLRPHFSARLLANNTPVLDFAMNEPAKPDHF